LRGDEGGGLRAKGGATFEQREEGSIFDANEALLQCMYRDVKKEGGRDIAAQKKKVGQEGRRGCDDQKRKTLQEDKGKGGRFIFLVG